MGQAGAPRRALRLCRAAARGAHLLACLCLAVPVAAAAREAGFQDVGGPVIGPHVVAAQYEAPTRRYPHGVLGDTVEHGALAVTLAGGRVLRHALPEDRVFEDIAPRLWDVTGDGVPEIVTVESHEARGARLTVWHVAGGLARLAVTPWIGTRFRWLAPVGAADMDGDGRIEIAHVDRPHLAKTLRVWRYTDGALEPVAAASGLTNHRIGWDHVAGGLRDCADAPEMVLASGDWSRVFAVRLEGGALRARDLGAYSAEAIDAAMECRRQ